MKNIGLFGIGCIGSILTKYLFQNSANNYFYFNRSHKDKIEISFNQQVTSIPIQLSKTVDRPLDWMIICLKEYQLADAHVSINQFIHPETNIAVFRNGIHLTEGFADYIKPNQILETIIDCPTQKTKKSQLLQFQRPKVTLPTSKLATEFEKLFVHPDIDFNLTNNFKTEQWKKLIESSALGSIQALTKKPCSVFSDPHRMAEYNLLVQESIEVAQSEGIEINQGYAQELINKLKTYPDTKGSSMLSDALSGKPLELNAKIGAVLRVARNNNIAVPTTNRIYKLLDR